MSKFLSASVLAGALLLNPAGAWAQVPTEGAPTGSGTAAASPQVAELQKALDRWDQAVDQRDQYGLELVLAPGFIAVADTGEVWNRDQIVSQLVKHDATRYTLSQKVVSVQPVGDVTIALGTYERDYPGSRVSRKKPYTQKGVFTQVYVRQHGRWECIRSQQTMVSASIAASEKKKSKKQSGDKSIDHDLGFHIPGIH
jgi:hypothetical protein